MSESWQVGMAVTLGLFGSAVLCAVFLAGLVEMFQEDEPNKASNGESEIQAGEDVKAEFL